MSKNTVQENINRAIQIHVENAIKGLQYNKTELVEIVDITNRDKGEYTVFNGSVKYFAYSENTSYALKTKVYVNIPNNDYSQQKIIIGKYKPGGDNVAYISPWENLFNPLTKDFISEANKKSKTISSSQENNEIKILELSNQKISGYEYMGVSAEFKAAFSGKNSGNYGIYFQLDYKEPQVPGKAVNTETLYYNFDTSSMIGNLYNFPAFYKQEAVFELPKDITITGITAILFCDEDLRESGILAARNLVVKFGNKKTLELDTLKLECAEGNKYDSSKDEKIIDNKNENGKVIETTKNEKTLTIFWQHYDKDEQKLVDIKAGQTKLNSGEAVDIYYKIIWLQKKNKTVGDDNDKLEQSSYNKDWNILSSGTNFSYGPFIPDFLQQEDSYKVIIEYGPKDDKNEIDKSSYFYKKLESEPYKFENVVKIPDYTSLDFANAQIIIDDDYEGHYHIYDGKNGKILNRSDYNKERTFYLVMNSTYTQESYLTKQEEVYWVLPKSATMLNFEPYISSNITEELNATNADKKLSKINKYITNNKYYVIKQENLSNYLVKYQIKEYYTKQAINNTVLCFIYKNKQLAQTEFQFTFGQHGTAGTDYTLTLGLGNLYNSNWEIQGGADSALTYGSSNYREIIFALYDENNKEINLTSNQKNIIINRWINDENDGYLYGGDKAKQYLEFITQKSGNNNIRAAVKVKTGSWDRKKIGGIIFKIRFNNSNYAFTQYLPLHIKTNSNYQLEGSDSIIYSDSGTNPVYYKDKFKLINGEDITYNVYSKSESDVLKKYLPTFSNNILNPSPLYIDIGESVFVVIRNSAGDGIYTFPLLIIQNAYGVPAVNTWNGSLTIDNENNQILSAMVGAGKKNDNNTFSGVLMGEVKTDDKTLYGLYGYDKGIQSYGFKIDGTAFIGKSGTGRISFNGTKGIIESANYSNGIGTQLDLLNGSLISNGKLTLEGATGSSLDFTGNLTKDPSGAASVTGSPEFKGYIRFGITPNPYFRVGYTKKEGSTTITKNFLQFDDNNSLLQSANYDFTSGNRYSNDGTLINLRTGGIRSKNFVITTSGDAYFKGNGEFEGMITATSGKIGGWKIDENSLKAGNITINPEGSITSSGGEYSWSINDDGSATFSKVTITGGTLSLNGIKYDSKSLKNNGSWSSVKDWDNNTLGRYIDQRIADFDDVNIWGKLTAHQEVFMKNEDASEIDQFVINSSGKLIIKSTSTQNYFNQLKINTKLDFGISTKTTQQDFYDDWCSKIICTAPSDSGGPNIDGTSSTWSGGKKDLKDVIYYYIMKWINDGGTGFDGKMTGSGDNIGKKLGDSNWVRSPGNDYPQYADSSYSTKTWSNCTWSMYEIVYTRHGKQWTHWGNAVHWLDKARNLGYDTSTNINAIEGNSVIVLGTGSSTGDPGHLVYVISVKNKDLNHCHFMEGNWLGDWREVLDGNPYGSGRKTIFRGYIYLGYGHSNMPGGHGGSNSTIIS